MFEKLTNSIKNKINTIKEENDNYKQLLETTTIFTDFLPITKNNQEISEHKVYYINNTCPDINNTKATLISNLIPLEETYLDAYYAKEILTNKEYFIIPTNLKIWIINTEGYKILSPNEIQISIIKNNIMSKTILLNNILLEINGTNEKINKFINIINNPQERQNITLEQTKYLCGIIPIYQKINYINSGISIDKENNIVIHNKETNFKCNIKEIINYEILLDNQSYYSKSSQSKTAMTNFLTSCYKISIRITLQNNNQILIPILEPNSFGTKYQSQDTTFQTNINFAMTIIKKLDELSTI